MNKNEPVPNIHKITFSSCIDGEITLVLNGKETDREIIHNIEKMLLQGLKTSLEERVSGITIDNTVLIENSSMSSIRLSEEHGLNPSLIKCFICGENVGIAMNGRLPKDQKAPMYVINGEICNKCKSIIDNGYIAIIECSNPVSEPVSLENVELLGRSCFVKKHIINIDPNSENKFAFCGSEFMDEILQMYNTAKQGEDNPEIEENG